MGPVVADTNASSDGQSRDQQFVAQHERLEPRWSLRPRGLFKCHTGPVSVRSIFDSNGVTVAVWVKRSQVMIM